MVKADLIPADPYELSDPSQFGEDVKQMALGMTDVNAADNLRVQLNALEKLAGRRRKDAVQPIRKALRWCEVKIGDLLPPREKGGRGKQSLASDTLSADDKYKFRRMAEHKDYIAPFCDNGYGRDKILKEISDREITAVATNRNKRLRNSVHHADFRELAKQIDDASVELIFTDPPWDAGVLDLYEDMGKIAARILVPGGSLLTYVNPQYVRKVVDMIAGGEYVPYFFCCTDYRDGPSHELAKIGAHGLIMRSMPILWFTRGKRLYQNRLVENGILRPKFEKTTHPWQQALCVAEYYIDRLTSDQALVFDPFCGGATTAVAAKKLGRSFITCDIDSITVERATERIATVS